MMRFRVARNTGCLTLWLVCDSPSGDSFGLKDRGSAVLRIAWQNIDPMGLQRQLYTSCTLEQLFLLVT